MNNFVARTITGILFVATIVVCFLNPTAMIFLFALVTGLTVWEFTGLVNDRSGVTVNRFISTVAGVYFFLAMAGTCSGFTSSTVFIPYLITIVYLLIAELYAKQEDPIHDWAYTMMSQMYVVLPFSLLNMLAFRAAPEGLMYIYTLPLSVFVFLWVNDTGAYLCGTTLSRYFPTRLFPRISPGKSWVGSIGGGLLTLAASVAVWYFSQPSLTLPQWLGFAMVVVVFGTWGDLVESLIKRHIGVKDSGAILPGHGGMLDRLDSALLSIPATVAYLLMVG